MTNLERAYEEDGKIPLDPGHTHPWSEITGLQELMNIISQDLHEMTELALELTERLEAIERAIGEMRFPEDRLK